MNLRLLGERRLKLSAFMYGLDRASTVVPRRLSLRDNVVVIPHTRVGEHFQPANLYVPASGSSQQQSRLHGVRALV